MEVKSKVSSVLVAAAASLSLTSCATPMPKDQSQSCIVLRQKFKDSGLDIDNFRDASKKIETSYPSFVGVIKYDEMGRNWDLDKNLSDREIGFLKFHAGETCGYVNESRVLGALVGGSGDRGFDLRSTSIDDVLKRVKKFYSANQRRDEASKTVEEARKAAQIIKINEVYVDLTKVKYPNQAGELKEAAASKRKAFLQENIANVLWWAYFIGLNNKEIGQSLESHVQAPLDRSAQEVLKTRFQTTLADYDISWSEAPPKSWREFVLSHGSSQVLSEFNFRAVNDGRDSDEYVKRREAARALGSLDSSERGHLLKFKSERQRYLATLLMMNSKITVQRPSSDEIEITLTIDFPKFFNEYPLRKTSEFTE